MSRAISALAAGLKKLRPEIVCLQEVYRDPKSGRSQAELVAEMCRLNHHVGESGLSIISSQPAVRSVIEPLPQMLDDPPRGVLLAEFVVETRRLLVINTHLAYRPKMVEGRRKQAAGNAGGDQAPRSETGRLSKSVVRRL